MGSRVILAGMALAGAAAACGGGEPGPVPVVEGRYTGTWSLEVEGDRVACPAALTITDQVDGAFATVFEVLRRDGDGVGCADTVQSGTGAVEPGGTVTALAEAVEPVTCVLAGANRGLSGPARGDSLRLSGRYTYECPQAYTWTFGFAGSTSGAALPGYADVRGSYAGAWATLAQGVVVTCPVAVDVATQLRDDLTGTYTLEAAGSCVAQPPAALAGTITVDGALALAGTPPVSPGCTVERPLALTGAAEGARLDVLGSYALRCGGAVREFEVSVGVGR